MMVTHKCVCLQYITDLNSIEYPSFVNDINLVFINSISSEAISEILLLIMACSLLLLINKCLFLR